MHDKLYHLSHMIPNIDVTTSTSFYSSILPAIIGMVGVLIGAFIAAFIAWKNSVSLGISEENKIHQQFTSMLLSERIKYYPELWEIVSNVYGVKKASQKLPEESVKHNRDLIRPQLRMWRKKYGIFLSEKAHLIKGSDIDNVEYQRTISSIQAFRKLDESMNLPNHYQGYDAKKIRDIDFWRNVLMKTLKYDIGILDESEQILKRKIN